MMGYQEPKAAILTIQFDRFGMRQMPKSTKKPPDNTYQTVFDASASRRLLRGGREGLGEQHGQDFLAYRRSGVHPSGIFGIAKLSLIHRQPQHQHRD